MKLRRAPTLVLVTALPSDDPVLGGGGRARGRGCDVRACSSRPPNAGSRPTGGRRRASASRPFASLLGLAESEVIVALVHLGPPVTDPPAKERAPVEDVFTVLP